MVITHLIETKRTSDKRFLVFKEPTDNKFCKFFDIGKTGREYKCNHCSKIITRKGGSGRGQLMLL